MKPEIRFKGFEGEWKKKKLEYPEFNIIAGGDVNKKLLKSSGKYPVLANALSNNGIVGYYDDSFRVEAPAVTVTGRGDIGHAKARTISFTPVVRLLAIKSSHDVEFLANAINRFKTPIESTGVPQLTTDKLSEYSIFFPEDGSEEISIGKYCKSIDQQISSVSSRLTSLRQVKEASLQAMFPQEGENVPRIRFKGFEGEWAISAFSDMFIFLKNNSLSRAQLSQEGEIGNVHYGDVLIKFGELLDLNKESIPFIADNKTSKKLYSECNLLNGDIIFADAAEDNTVGKCTEMVIQDDQKVVSGLHTIPCRPRSKFASGFLGYALNANSFHDQLLPQIQGSKISSISRTVLRNTQIKCPKDIKEQTAIASYFRSLDRQITLQSQRLEKLKQIKAACLDKMFV